ncbi:MAG: hypothetical protein WCD76_20755 [Pyrinomonadaceae bacterium]
MSEQINPGESQENEASESGLFLSAEPLNGGANIKASADDSNADVDSSDTSGGTDKDMGGSGDADTSDESGAYTGGGGDADTSDEASDADGSDVADADGTDTGRDADGADPLGIASDGKDAS